MNQDFQCWWTN